MEITGGARVDAGQAPTAKVEDLAALSPRWDLQRYRAAHHRHIDVGAERELRVGHKNFGVEVLAVALEPRVLFHLEHDEDVTTRTATRTHVADPAHRHVLASSDARGNPHSDLLLAANASLASAFLARRGDDGAFT